MVFDASHSSCNFRDTSHNHTSFSGTQEMGLEFSLCFKHKHTVFSSRYSNENLSSLKDGKGLKLKQTRHNTYKQSPPLCEEPQTLS